MRRWTLIKRWRRNERGAVAIEFAFIFPIMVVFMVTVVGAFDAYRVSVRTAEAAATTADLTSRLTSVNAGQFTQLFATADALLNLPENRATIAMQIYSVAHWPNTGGSQCDGREMPGGGCLTIAWFRSNNDAQPPALNTLDLPEIPRGESIIQTVVAVDYTYVFSLFDDDVAEITRTSTRRPRFTNEVTAD